ncbi:MAG: hypothetical protein OXN25_04980 [Candidatus Poribacteria bacterium]|nr:hypothetical protein [Candidatus Poribacteria bacterium]
MNRKKMFLTSHSHRLYHEIYSGLRLLSPVCFLLFCIVWFTFIPENTWPAEFGEEVLKAKSTLNARIQERKQKLLKLASAPLKEENQKLLTKLLGREAPLEHVLSSPAYLAYLKEHLGKSYKDFPAYLQAMPTPEREASCLFLLKAALPAQATPKEIQQCVPFYFRLRQVFTRDPRFLENLGTFQSLLVKHFLPPIIEEYPKQEWASKTPVVMQLGMIPYFMAHKETQVYHEVWQKQLETYGSHEGLLRCAILTPGEFALVRSFFENTEVFEKWIGEPVKKSTQTETEKIK